MYRKTNPFVTKEVLDIIFHNCKKNCTSGRKVRLCCSVPQCSCEVDQSYIFYLKLDEDDQNDFENVENQLKKMMIVKKTQTDTLIYFLNV